VSLVLGGRVMKVLLLQLDGSLPNLALVRLAAHHRARGDAVELRQARTAQAVERGLWDAFGRVYASLIFERTRPVADALRRVYPDAAIGGTGWSLATTLEDCGVGAACDYSDYPEYRHSIGFTQRGCRLSCPFCVVAEKEGTVRPASSAHEIWRGEPWPRNLVLLDNDFFGQPGWRDRVREFREGGFRVNFNQGINARFLTDEAAEAIASLDYFDADFRQRRVYTAWDSKKDEHRLFAGLNRLVKAGVRPGRIMVYILIGYWVGETEQDWLYRQSRIRDFGADPYPMPYVRTPLTRGFQRWVCGHYDRRIPWEEFKAAECEPRRLGRQRIPLPLMENDHA
jgi:hypothetical protein